MTNDTESIPRAFVALDFMGDDLDPASLIPLIPLKPGRPSMKGQRRRSSVNGRLGPPAPTGHCGFSTARAQIPGSGNSHLRFMLDLIGNRLADIQSVMRAQSVSWCLTFFDGPEPDQQFSSLDPRLVERCREIDLPLVQKIPDRVEIVYDRPDGWGA